MINTVNVKPDASRWTPGSIIRARGREWIVLTGGAAEVLRVRPVSGTEDDQTFIHLGLETEPVCDATFPLPTVDDKRAGHDAALLLRDALLLSLRSGAGPFRSFGHISVEPRAYQLVPLLMALKQDPVRLLIADDTGVGKTIEGGLIARELLDRGEIERTAVLCPPHLVDQWVGEMDKRFHIHSVAVTAAGAARLERNLPPGESIFLTYPHTVVSLDYIKSDRRRNDFQRTCPEFVIVDEAHTCASTGRGRHQRYELLKGLVDPTNSKARHLVLLTATPHSGDEDAFYRLLSLLDNDFVKLKDLAGDERTELRERLAENFVQRRRPDIAEWKDGSIFPTRKTAEGTYKLTGPWEHFFDEVLDYCADIVESAGSDDLRRPLNFWGTLALMRCVASSPAAAAQALRTRAGLDDNNSQEVLESSLFDGVADSLSDDDVEPPVGTETPQLKALIKQAEMLTGQTGDPKLKLLIDHLRQMVSNKFKPIVFCRYIATARYVGEQLKKSFTDFEVAIITGELTSDERSEKVATLGESENRILVATDCLSEGINLQGYFDAVVHYDLSWNPTRHEQREGRVDRFGQKSKEVLTTLIYGENNPVDGAVLKVILRKAEKIRKDLGVFVPLPDDGHSLSQALLKAVLLHRRTHKQDSQLAFGFMETEAARDIDIQWQNAADRAKASQTIFAQRKMKPDEVLPEWSKALEAIGGKDRVHQFTSRSCARLGAGLESLRGRGFKIPLKALPEEVKERLESEGLSGTVFIDFEVPAAPGCQEVQRTHPLISVIADTLLENSIGDASVGMTADASVLGRLGCWVSGGVETVTTVALLRLRHQLSLQTPNRSPITILAEEASAIGWNGSKVFEGPDALALLAPDPLMDPPEHVRERAISNALTRLDSCLPDIDSFARRRAEELLADHRRVRAASNAHGTYSVKTLLPADIIGLYVILPPVK